MHPTYKSALSRLREYYDSGATRPLAFRTQQLLTLRNMLITHETAIAKALNQDLGKSIEESYATETGLLLAEISHAIKHLKKWISPVRAKTTLPNFPSSSKIYRDPLGVVLIVGAWNYPFLLTLLPAVAAIAAGNCVVLKPSELAPATASLTEKLITENFADNYVKVITGPGEELIPPMIETFRFDHIFYTGSVNVGRIINQLAAPQLIPVTLELGGKSPAIVEADADIAVTAKRITLGKWLNAGQTCIAPDYILVHESVKQQLTKALIQSIQSFYTTNPAQSYDYGRIISAHRMSRLIDYLRDGTLIFGGEYDIDKLYFGPTIIGEVDIDAPIMKEEIFGPLLPVIGYTTREQAMSIINRNPDPLALYVFTRDKKSAAGWMANTSFGAGCINNTAYHFTNYHLPFGGTRQSGMGAYHGKYGFDLFSRPKPVMTTPFWFDPRFKYPTFKGKIQLLKRMFR